MSSRTRCPIARRSESTSWSWTQGKVQLDVLYPTPGATPRRKLVLDRGLASRGGSPIHQDAGEQRLISISDDLGNDESFLALGHGGYPVYSPVWDPSGQSIYYAVEGILAHEDQLVNLGVFRYELDQKKRTRVWGAGQTGVDPQAIALSPDGNAMVASNTKSILLLTNLRGSTVQSQVLGQATPVASNWGFSPPVAWAPSAFVYVPAYDKDATSGAGRILRSSPEDRRLEPAVVVAGQDIANFPLPLSDGRFLFTRSSSTPSPTDPGSIWVAQADGSVSELFGPAKLAVAFDPETQILLYITRDQLHRRDLKTGRDLVIVSLARSAARAP